MGRHISIHALLAESDTLAMHAGAMCMLFLSTLSLRRATKNQSSPLKNMEDFYPRSPCGERLQWRVLRHPIWQDFYPRSPCGERRQYNSPINPDAGISIHALLAESDSWSACRIRRAILFLSTLSLRRATAHRAAEIPHPGDFYPRSPCGERLLESAKRTSRTLFLSTLSLRRATFCQWMRPACCGYFYPRSPCGERLIYPTLPAYAQ